MNQVFNIRTTSNQHQLTLAADVQWVQFSTQQQQHRHPSPSTLQHHNSCFCLYPHAVTDPMWHSGLGHFLQPLGEDDQTLRRCFASSDHNL